MDSGICIDILEKRLSGAATAVEAAQILASWARELTGCRAALVRTLETDGVRSWGIVSTHDGAQPSFLRDESMVPAGSCLCGEVLSGNGPDLDPDGAIFLDRLTVSPTESTPAPRIRRGARCWTEGYESLAIVPLTARGRIVGCLHLADPRPDIFAAHSTSLAEACRLAGAPLVDLRAQQPRDQVATIVTQALMPAIAPGAEGISTGVAFTSATELAALGGDFYDVVSVGREVFFLVGDCSGKGLEAVSTSTEARRLVSSLAPGCSEPAELLAAANCHLMNVCEGDHFVTLAICALKPSTGQMRMALAGHPGPLLLTARPSGRSAAEPDVPHGPPLGLFADSSYCQAETILGADDVLLLYTDGVTDSRSEGRMFGVEGIERVWEGSVSEDVADLAGLICRESAAFHGTDLPSDDRLVLAVRRASQA
jgi:hypothetical protein